MPNTTNKSQFAIQVGVSKAAVSKACKEGRICLTGKLVNLDDPTTKEYIRIQSEKPNKNPPAKKPAKKATTKKATSPKAETLSDEESEGEKGQQEFSFTCLDDITPENIKCVSKTQMDIFSKYETALKVKQERQEKRGSLVERSFIKTIFSKLYSIHVNQFKTMESRMTADICGLFKFPDSCDEAVELRKMFNDDTSDTLKNIQRLFDDAIDRMDEK